MAKKFIDSAEFRSFQATLAACAERVYDAGLDDFRKSAPTDIDGATENAQVAGQRVEAMKHLSRLNPDLVRSDTQYRVDAMRDAALLTGGAVESVVSNQPHIRTSVIDPLSLPPASRPAPDFFWQTVAGKELEEQKRQHPEIQQGLESLIAELREIDGLPKRRNIVAETIADFREDTRQALREGRLFFGTGPTRNR